MLLSKLLAVSGTTLRRSNVGVFGSFCRGIEPRGWYVARLPSELPATYRTVACGVAHAVILSPQDSAAVFVGTSQRGQCGVDPKADAGRHPSFPVAHQLPPGAADAAACGKDFTFLWRRGSRSVWACGANEFGQSSTASADFSATLAPWGGVEALPKGAAIVAIRCGSNHAVAVLDDGTAWAWGCNHFGQLGLAAATPHETSQPLPVCLPRGAGRVVDAACGPAVTLVVCADGGVYSCGDPRGGALGRAVAAGAPSDAMHPALDGARALVGPEGAAVAVGLRRGYAVMGLAAPTAADADGGGGVPTPGGSGGVVSVVAAWGSDALHLSGTGSRQWGDDDEDTGGLGQGVGVVGVPGVVRQVAVGFSRVHIRTTSALALLVPHPDRPPAPPPSAAEDGAAPAAAEAAATPERQTLGAAALTAEGRFREVASGWDFAMCVADPAHLPPDGVPTVEFPAPAPPTKTRVGGGGGGGGVVTGSRGREFVTKR